MTTKNTSGSSTQDRELVVTRLINAPRELVWKVWTEPEHIAKWWGPNGFTNTIRKMNVKEGGEWLFIMHGPGGMDFPNKIIYSEVVKPERLVYTHSGDDGNKDQQFETTVTFEAVGNKTNLTMRAVFASAEVLARLIKEVGAKEGGIQTINRLEEYLEKM